MEIITRLMGDRAMINWMSAFTSWLNERLQDRGWSYSELGRQAGVSQGSVSLVMSEQQEPSWEFCSKIADALNLPTELVLRRAGKLPSDNESPTFRELVDLLRDMPIKEQNEVLAYALFRRNARPAERRGGAGKSERESEASS